MPTRFEFLPGFEDMEGAFLSSASQFLSGFEDLKRVFHFVQQISSS